jgi:hypothetical protein
MHRQALREEDYLKGALRRGLRAVLPSRQKVSLSKRLSDQRIAVCLRRARRERPSRRCAADKHDELATLLLSP